MTHHRYTNIISTLAIVIRIFYQSMSSLLTHLLQLSKLEFRHQRALEVVQGNTTIFLPQMTFHSLTGNSFLLLNNKLTVIYYSNSSKLKLYVYTIIMGGGGNKNYLFFNMLDTLQSFRHIFQFTNSINLCICTKSFGKNWVHLNNQQ